MTQSMTQRINQLTDERDGLQMRIQALEAKINGQTKNIERMTSIMRELAAAAKISERLVMRITALAIEKAFGSGQEYPKQKDPCNTCADAND